jgi:cell volume regulation protein A
VPTGNTILQRGDQLLVVATTASRAAAEERLRAVSKDGKLARWYGGKLPQGTEVTDRRRR